MLLKYSLAQKNGDFWTSEVYSCPYISKRNFAQVSTTIFFMKKKVSTTKTTNQIINIIILTYIILSM